MLPRPPVRVLLASAVLAAAAIVPAGQAPASSGCKVLKVTSGLKSDLHDAHARLTDRPFTGPKGHVYYGRCGTKYYALASFKDKELSYQDQPEQFTRSAGHGWKDRGDTGGPPCDTRVPRALLRLWGFSC